MNKYLLSNVRFYFAQSVFTNTCHYKAYYRLEKRKKLISNIVLGLSGTTIILLILHIIGLEQGYKSLISVVAFTGLALTGASLTFELINKEDLAMLMFQHQNIAEKYKVLRDEYMSLIGDMMADGVDGDEFKQRRSELQKRYSALGESSPATSYEDYKNAQKSLGLENNSDEEFTWSDEEINKFLPKELRLVQE